MAEKKSQDKKKKVVSMPKDGAAETPKKEEAVRRTSGFSVAMPYVLICFSLILAICFITVQLFGADDGAGVIGYAIQAFFCGLVGSAAFLLPVILFYIGLKKCIYNIRWSPNSKWQPSATHNRVTDRRRVTVLTVTSLLLVVLVSVFLGVINDYSGIDVGDMWSDAAETPTDWYGGLIGSVLGTLMITCFEKVISFIILTMLLLVDIFFMVGLTPAKVIDSIQERREYAQELREEEEAEARRLALEAESEEKKHRNRMIAADNRSASGTSSSDGGDRKKKKNPVDTLLAEDDSVGDDDGDGYIPPDFDDRIIPSDGRKGKDSYIDTRGKVVTLADDRDDDNKGNVGDDFGGDPAFDKTEYTELDGLMKDLDGKGKKNGAQIPADASDDGDKKDSSDGSGKTEKNALDVDEILKSLNGSEQDGNTGKKAGDKEKENKRESKEEDDEDVEYVSLEHMENDELLSEMSEVAPEDGDGEEEEEEIVTPYVFPPVDMLAANPNSAEEDFTQELNENAQRLLDTLRSFKVSIDAITYSRGPTITRYELKPAAGTRVRAIANLVDDIALSLATSGVRIEAPIPNKPAVGVEVPNRTRATVYLRDLIDSPKFMEAKGKLTASLGKDVGGNPIYFDVTKMPHLLIAGATGMGKSVCINTIIISLLYKATPDELKLILIDPKKVEFTMYKNIPHLYAPIVSDPKKAAGALASAVAEMDRRFELIEDVGVRDIGGYNAVADNDPEIEHMPHMVIIIDELADLMMTSPDEVETSICRLAQKARAAGIHIIIGTQRPSVDVITGLIKANIPSRIACTVASQTDSRTILDGAGAEKLIGKGDMLFAPVGASKPMRVQGAFVSDSEVDSIVSFIRDNNASGKYNQEFINRLEEEAAKCGNGKKGAQSGGGDDMPSGDSGEKLDDKFEEAVKLALENGKIATSLLQRHLGVGYGRAAKIIDSMEAKGYVGKADGTKPRKVLITMDEYLRLKMNGEGSASSEDDDEF